MFDVNLFPLQAWGQDLGVQFESTGVAIGAFAIFAVAMVGIGLYAARFTSGNVDYYAAGRRGSLFVISLSIFAGVQSGWGMVGSPGQAYLTGFAFLVFYGTVPIGFLLGYWFLARKMRSLAYLKDAITAPDAVLYRYEDKRVHLLSIFGVIVGSIGFLATQYAAFGVIGAVLLPVNFFEAVVLGLVIVGLYTTIGGMLAAIWSDAVQGVMMIISAVLIAIYAFISFPNDFSGVYTTLSEQVPSMLTLNAPAGLILSWFVIAAFHSAQPQFISKLMMAEDSAQLRWGGLIAGAGYLITMLFWVAGIVARAAEAAGLISIPTADAAIPVLLIEFTPPLVTAFVLASILAAIMSSSNAFINITAAAVTYDFYQQYQGNSLTDAGQVRWARIVTVIVLILALIVAATFPGIVFTLGAAALGVYISIFLPAVIMGYNWKRITSESVLWGGGIGALLAILLAFGGQYLGFSLPFGFLGGQFANIITVVLVVLISLATSTKNYDDIEDEDIKLIMDIPPLKGSPFGKSESDNVSVGDD